MIDMRLEQSKKILDFILKSHANAETARSKELWEEKERVSDLERDYKNLHYNYQLPKDLTISRIALDDETDTIWVATSDIAKGLCCEHHDLNCLFRDIRDWMRYLEESNKEGED